MVKFTGQEQRVYDLLKKTAGPVSRKTFMDMLYLNRSSPKPGTKIIDVFICKIRKKLPESEMILAVWGTGYELKAVPERPIMS